VIDAPNERDGEEADGAGYEFSEENPGGAARNFSLVQWVRAAPCVLGLAGSVPAVVGLPTPSLSDHRDRKPGAELTCKQSVAPPFARRAGRTLTRMGALEPGHLIIILAIALLIFGPGKAGELGGTVGRALRDFRDATEGKTPAPPAL